MPDQVRQGGAIKVYEFSASGGAYAFLHTGFLSPEAAPGARIDWTLSTSMRESNMPRATLKERVAALESQVGDLLANAAGIRRAKDWRRTRGAFTGDDLMKQVFGEGRRIREAARTEAGAR
jgi:hypothetical protein